MNTARDASDAATSAPITPAVVLGAGVNGLGVARSLARAHIPVFLLDEDSRCPEMRTRTAIPMHVQTLHGDAVVDDLVRFGTGPFAGLRPVLFLTQEGSVTAVSQQRDRLAALYRFRLPTVEVVAALQHKYGFQRLAEKFAAPVPALVRVRTSKDLPELDHLTYPVVVKPGARDAEYGRQFKKAYRVETPEAARDLVRRIIAVMPDVVVQEWIQGADSDIYFCLQYRADESRAVASFTGRKLRSWPPQVGGTASCMPAPDVHAELSRLTTQFFCEAGVVGMASMEYKRDVRDGKFRMVEPTVGRTDYQEEVAALNGVNVPYAAYCAECGLPLPAPPAARRPVIWHVRSQDMQSAAAQGEHPEHGRPRGTAVVDALWRWNDPMPAVAAAARRVRHVLRHRGREYMARSRAARSKP